MVNDNNRKEHEDLHRGCKRGLISLRRFFGFFAV